MRMNRALMVEMRIPRHGDRRGDDATGVAELLLFWSIWPFYRTTHVRCMSADNVRDAIDEKIEIDAATLCCR
jgi:hypothetical protein